MIKTINTKNENFTIRPFQLEDERDVLDLWHAAFGRQMPYNLWRWKYIDNPYGYQIMLCVNESGVPVVMFAGIPYKAIGQGQCVRITHAVDNMSHPGYRGIMLGKRGLFVKTAETFFEFYGGPSKSVFFYGFPGKRHFLLGKYLLGYEQLPNRVCYFDISVKDLKTKGKTWGNKIEPFISNSNEQKLKELIQKEQGNLSLSIKRDTEFLKWRFVHHPQNRYEIWAYKSLLGKNLKGYAVLFFEQERAKLLDLFISSKERQVQDFWKKLGQELDRRKIEELEVWIPEGHFLTEALYSLGFADKPEPIGFIPAAVSRTFHSGFSYAWGARHLYYTMADADLF